jgi:hypothetical protein
MENNSVRSLVEAKIRRELGDSKAIAFGGNATPEQAKMIEASINGVVESQANAAVEASQWEGRIATVPIVCMALVSCGSAVCFAVIGLLAGHTGSMWRFWFTVVGEVLIVCLVPFAAFTLLRCRRRVRKLPDHPGSFYLSALTGTFILLVVVLFIERFHRDHPGATAASWTEARMKIVSDCAVIGVQIAAVVALVCAIFQLYFSSRTPLPLRHLALLLDLRRGLFRYHEETGQRYSSTRMVEEWDRQEAVRLQYALRYLARQARRDWIHRHPDQPQEAEWVRRYFRRLARWVLDTEPGSLSAVIRELDRTVTQLIRMVGAARDGKFLDFIGRSRDVHFPPSRATVGAWFSRGEHALTGTAAMIQAATLIVNTVLLLVTLFVVRYLPDIQRWLSR